MIDNRDCDISHVYTFAKKNYIYNTCENPFQKEKSRDGRLAPSRLIRAFFFQSFTLLQNIIVSKRYLKPMTAMMQHCIILNIRRFHKR